MLGMDLQTYSRCGPRTASAMYLAPECPQLVRCLPSSFPFFLFTRTDQTLCAFSFHRVQKKKIVVALSSAEADLYGFVRASAETMGLISMYKDLGTHMNGVGLGDASAAPFIWTQIICGSKSKQPRVS